jgi:hypothetical protein
VTVEIPLGVTNRGAQRHGEDPGSARIPSPADTAGNRHIGRRPGGFDVRTLESLLATGLRGAGLDPPEVEVNLADSGALARHPETGKTRRFIRLPT